MYFHLIFLGFCQDYTKKSINVYFSLCSWGFLRDRNMRFCVETRANRLAAAVFTSKMPSQINSTVWPYRALCILTSTTEKQYHYKKIHNRNIYYIYMSNVLRSDMIFYIHAIYIYIYIFKIWAVWKHRWVVNGLSK